MHLLNMLESIGKIGIYSKDCDSEEEFLISMNETKNRTRKVIIW